MIWRDTHGQLLPRLHIEMVSADSWAFLLDIDKILFDYAYGGTAEGLDGFYYSTDLYYPSELHGSLPRQGTDTTKRQLLLTLDGGFLDTSRIWRGLKIRVLNSSFFGCANNG